MVNRVNTVFLVKKYSILSWHYVKGKRSDIRLHAYQQRERDRQDKGARNSLIDFHLKQSCRPVGTKEDVNLVFGTVG